MIELFSVRNLRTALMIGVGVGAVYIALEALLFWPHLPTALREALFSAPLSTRFATYVPAACLDELIWRFIGVSALVWLITKIRGENRASTIAIAIVAIAAIYVVVHLPFLTSRTELTPFLATRELVLHFLTPVIWGVVYYRYGLLAAMTAHSAAHIPIQLGATLLIA